MPISVTRFEAEKAKDYLNKKGLKVELFIYMNSNLFL